MSQSDTDAQESDEPLYHNEKWLREQYVSKNKTTPEMADQCGVAPSTIRSWMVKKGIERNRSRSLAGDAIENLSDEEWLKCEYVGKDKTVATIADELDLSPGCVNNWLRKHGIEITDRYVKSAGRELEKLRDESWLRQRYEEVGSSVQIAEELDLAQSTVHNYLKKYDIETEQFSGHPPGEDNPGWKGGYSNGRGPEWRQTRESVLERDDMRCQSCGQTQREHKEEYGSGLHAHHLEKRISFETPSDADRMDNLVTLCAVCHRRWEGIPLRPVLIQPSDD